MRYKINSNYQLFIIFLAFIFSSNIGRCNSEDRIYNLVGKYVFQIKTAIKAKSSKASYGTGFVVDKSGLLITNYHVVADALQDEDKQYHIYLVDKEISVPATVVGIDIIHDLALIKVDKKFAGKLKIIKKIPPQGESLFSLGLPKDLKMSIVKGTNNGLIKNSIYEQILMSSAINSGMSGGPTVDKKGRVVGINVSILLESQSISFAIPAIHAISLMERYKQNPEVNLTSTIDSEITKQLKKVTTYLISDMLENSGLNSNLGEWHFAPPSKTLKCWSQNLKHTKKTYEVNSQTCFLQDGSYISDSIYSGSYELQFRMIKNISRNKVQFYNLLRTLYNKGQGVSNKYLKYYNDDLITKYHCNEKIIVNKNNIPLKINYCLNTFIKYKDIYRLYFKVVTLSTDNDALIINAKIDGFDKESLMKLLDYQLSHIEKRKGEKIK